MGRNNRSQYVDILRGISIFLVLIHHFSIVYRYEDNDSILSAIFHASRYISRNGNYAVTMFFAISGYLITSNAYRHWGVLSNIQIKTFYIFRAARILPCLLLLLIVVNLMAFYGFDIFQNHSEFSGTVSWWLVNLASLTYWINILMRFHGWFNYVLCAQWSLAIEEVFYIIFPIFCVLFRRERNLIFVWGVFISIGPIWRFFYHGSEYDELNSYLSCFDGIAFGCIAAVIDKSINPRPELAKMIILTSSFFMTIFYLTQWVGQSAYYGVTFMAFGTSVILVGQSRLKQNVWRFWVPVANLGRNSYELYLFHLLVLALIQIA